MATGMQITLAGRTGYWRHRVRTDGAAIIGAWLKHKAIGRIGIYIAAAEIEDPTLLPHHTPLCVTGTIAPITAQAHAGDNRSAVDPTTAPFLVAITQFHAWSPNQDYPPQNTASVRVHSVHEHRSTDRNRRYHTGAVGNHGDVCYHTQYMLHNGDVVPWDRVRGVVVPLNGVDFLRYVLYAPQPATAVHEGQRRHE